MARISIGPKLFAATMRSLYGYRNLKINRVIEKALRSNGTLVVNLDPPTAQALYSEVHEWGVGKVHPFKDEYAFAHDLARPTELRRPLVAHDSQLVLQMSPEEWSVLVTQYNDVPTTLGPTTLFNVTNISLDLHPIRDALNEWLSKLLARGNHATRT